jgi:hypothetical protein
MFRFPRRSVFQVVGDAMRERTAKTAAWTRSRISPVTAPEPVRDSQGASAVALVV